MLPIDGAPVTSSLLEASLWAETHLSRVLNQLVLLASIANTNEATVPDFDDILHAQIEIGTVLRASLSLG